MEHQIDSIQGIAFNDQEASSLVDKVTKFLDHHTPLSDGIIYARYDNSVVNIYPDDKSRILELTGPGGSTLLESTLRWVKLKIDETEYFVEYWTENYKPKKNSFLRYLL